MTEQKPAAAWFEREAETLALKLYDGPENEHSRAELQAALERTRSRISPPVIGGYVALGVNHYMECDVSSMVVMKPSHQEAATAAKSLGWPVESGGSVAEGSTIKIFPVTDRLAAKLLDESSALRKSPDFIQLFSCTINGHSVASTVAEDGMNVTQPDNRKQPAPRKAPGIRL